MCFKHKISDLYSRKMEETVSKCNMITTATSQQYLQTCIWLLSALHQDLLLESELWHKNDQNNLLKLLNTPQLFKYMTPAPIFSPPVPQNTI